MRNWIRQHPFLTLGLCTLLLFFTAETLRSQGAVAASERLAVPLRVLAIPMYLIWFAIVMLDVALAGPNGALGASRWLVAAVQIALGLAPYILADYLLRRWRANRHRRKLAA
jgi:hypothetical protein